MERLLIFEFSAYRRRPVFFLVEALEALLKNGFAAAGFSISTKMGLLLSIPNKAAVMATLKAGLADQAARQAQAASAKCRGPGIRASHTVIRARLARVSGLAKSSQ